MTVCSGATGGYGRGGTTIGGVFITGNDPIGDDLLSNEEKHADQWAIFDAPYGGLPVFPIYYFTAELVSGGCGNNPFEQWAGLDDGNYPKGPC
jgi:hypothetical protein